MVPFSAAYIFAGMLTESCKRITPVLIVAKLEVTGDNGAVLRTVSGHISPGIEVVNCDILFSCLGFVPMIK